MFILLFFQKLLTSRQLRSTRLFAAACVLVWFVSVWTNLFTRSAPFARRPKITAEQLSPRIQSVYIASVQYNSEAVLRERWVPSLLQLVKELRAANISVYVSIYENHSVDGTKTILSQLAEKLRDLNVGNTIHLDAETHADAIKKSISSPTGWLRTPYGKELRRIVYLADVRNRALKTLHDLNEAGTRFDRLLFLNDVIYSVRFRDPSRG